VDRPLGSEAEDKAAFPALIIGVVLKNLALQQGLFDVHHIEIVIESLSLRVGADLIAPFTNELLDLSEVHVPVRPLLGSRLPE
jgi:hypothetical protein